MQNELLIQPNQYQEKKFEKEKDGKTYNYNQSIRKSIINNSNKTIQIPIQQLLLNSNLDTNTNDNIIKELNMVKSCSIDINSILYNIENSILEKEKQRNYKLISDFNKEKIGLELEQQRIRSQIENISYMNSNEKYLNDIKSRKDNQQDLFNKYYKLNSDVEEKLLKLIEIKPLLEEKIRSKKQRLKNINHENLLLLEQIQMLKNRKIKEYKESIQESFKKKGNEINKSVDDNGNLNLNMNTIDENECVSIISNNKNGNNCQSNNESLINQSQIVKQIQNKNKQNLRYSAYGNGLATNNNKSILNITETVDNNNYLKDIFIENNKKSMSINRLLIENKELSYELTYINNQIFFLSKIFSEGMFELGVELRNLQEMQLDKAINNKKGNSLYFELVKDSHPPNFSGSCFPIEKDFKLPMIHKNILKKYNFPVVQKNEPKTFIYNVVKNMIDEHQLLNRNLNIKKKKFTWEEFFEFSAYQVYTLISLNKDVIKEIEKKIFPKNLLFLTMVSK